MMVKQTELWLVRHSETTANEEGIIQGHYDAPLSEKGREQARLLARRIALIPPDVIFSSDLSRASETAHAICEASNLPVHIDPRLREVDMGVWANLPIEEVARRYPTEWARSKAGDPNFRRGGGETAIEVQKRMVEAIDGFREKYCGQVIIIVSHGIAIRAYLAHCLGFSLANAYQRILLSSAGISCIRLPENGKPGKLVMLNDVCHLSQTLTDTEDF